MLYVHANDFRTSERKIQIFKPLPLLLINFILIVLTYHNDVSTDSFTASKNRSLQVLDLVNSFMVIAFGYTI